MKNETLARYCLFSKPGKIGDSLKVIIKPNSAIRNQSINNPIAAFLFNLNSIIEALKQTLCKNDPIEILIIKK